MTYPEQLEEALAKGALREAEEILQAGADINARDKHDGTVLQNVILNIDANQDLQTVVRFMLCRGADPRLNVGDDGGPLFATLLARDAATLRMLLEKGADPSKELTGDESLYDFAEFDYRYSIYDLRLPEQPSATDKASEEAWLKFLDRMAVRHNKERPICLFVLREYGARSRTERGQGD